jgi:hypothetical protein
MGLLWWKPFRREDVAILSELIESGRIEARHGQNTRPTT